MFKIFKKKDESSDNLKFAGINDQNITLLITVCILILAGVLFHLVFNSNYQVEETTSVILGSHNKTCEVDDDCCETSLRIVETEKFDITKDGKDCKEGYIKNALKCPTSLAWCEPENLSFGEEIFLVEVPDKDRKCESDDDCIVFQPDCGDCVVDVINKKSFNKYENEKFTYCSKLEAVYTSCDLEIDRAGKCKNNICTSPEINKEIPVLE